MIISETLPIYDENGDFSHYETVEREMTLAEERELSRELSNVPDMRTYEQRVEDYIRERYSVSDEFAILRQRYTKPDEFAEYDDYCEQCKERAKLELNNEV